MGTIVLFMKYAKILFGNYNEKFSIDVYSKIAIMISGILCFVGGIFGFEIINRIFEINLQVDFNKYLFYTVIFAISFIVAFVIYKFIIDKMKFFKSGHAIELSFNGISISVLTLFMIVFIYLYLSL